MSLQWDGWFQVVSRRVFKYVFKMLFFPRRKEPADSEDLIRPLIKPTLLGAWPRGKGRTLEPTEIVQGDRSGATGFRVRWLHNRRYGGG